MLISQNGETEKADNINAKMNSVDLNNVDAIKEKANSLNAQKVKNVNNIIEFTPYEKEKTFCNDEIKKHVSILFIILFLLTFLGASTVFCFITFTNKFNENIVENLVLKNNTKTMEWWVESPIQPLIKVYIFNYTNIDDYMSGRDKKIKVQEVGPYVYKEFGQRVNLQFDEDNKITFNDNKTLIYMPELSNGRSDEEILMVPNIPLVAALGKAQNLSGVENMAFQGILITSKPKEFQKKSVKEFMFGYSDNFISITPNMDPKRIGLLASRGGVSTDNLTVHTGEDTLDNLGKIYAMNGATKLNIWKTDECNEIVGTDGSQFPPHLMDKEEELSIFVKSFCRTLKLKYDREVSVLNGIPAWRYKTPEGGFASGLTNPEHKCYCDPEQDTFCPPDGVFDVSKCVDGIPLMVSYPHFMEGDESLFTHFEGLQPNRKKHETFADIHPRMAFPIGGASRLQMNFKVTQKDFSMFFSHYKWFTNFPKDIILPAFWLEVTAGEIPAEFQTIVFHTSQSANATYLAIQYGSIVAAFVSLLLLLSTSYIYVSKLTNKPAEKIQNKDVMVTFRSNLYPNIAGKSDE